MENILISETMYHHNKKHGKFKQYATGFFGEQTGLYLDDEIHGSFIVARSDGKLISNSEYMYGKLLKHSIYSEEGTEKFSFKLSNEYKVL